MPVARKYLPLCQFLATLPPDQANVRLTFAELEALVGLLPPTAHLAVYWADSAVARRNWLEHGFAATLTHADKAITFTRRRA